MENTRVLIIVCDGMADRPTRARGFQTPLTMAKKRYIDGLARTGSIGLMYPIGPGISPGSDTSHLAILGYDPYKYYTGRGALEAVGAGITLNPGEIAFRCNFATVDNNMIVIDRRVKPTPEERTDFALTINKLNLGYPKISLRFVPTVGHRAILILRGEGISRRVSDTDPHVEGRAVQRSTPWDDGEDSEHTADFMNEFTARSHLALKEHPANKERIKRGLPPVNVILSRGPGTIPPIQTLTAKYSITAACVAVVPVVRGICRLAGMNLIDVQGATGGLDTDYAAKADAAIAAMKEHDLVLLHIKAPDVASHYGDLEKKVWTIERIDEAVKRILESLDLNTCYVVLTSDHATPVTVRDHSADPVPILIAGPDFDESETPTFSEKTAAAGNLGTICALNLMPILMSRLGKTGKFGS